LPDATTVRVDAQIDPRALPAAIPICARAWEDLEQSLAEPAATIEAAQPASEKAKPEAAAPKRNRGALPEHLPRIVASDRRGSLRDA
jgi:hypothetical protein